jgi:ABC-2 type transport system permease protein
VRNKIGIVAGAEFGMLVRTRAFLITVLLMPVLVAGSIVVQRFIAKQVDRTPRAFAVLDRSGALYEEVAARTRERNAAVAAGLLAGAPFEPERADPGARSPDDERLALSERVRRGEIFAFVEIPADALASEGAGRIVYYSEHPTYEDLRTWLELVTNDQIRRVRLKRAGVDPEVVARLDRRVASEHVGLLARGPGGEIVSAGRVDVVRTYIVPLALMYILFLTIFMAAPQLMNAVMQEKMSRISEVLIGSVSAFELMMGKLLGSAGVSLVLALVYLGGGMAVAAYSGYLHAVTPSLVAYFVLFMALAVLLYGSIFIAVGAACSDLKDAQSLITPVMLVAVMPMFAWQLVLKSPSSPAAVALSLFPPATPFLMLLRLAVQPGPPWWQVTAGILLAAATAVACVWAAGKIFRVGILTQGKSPGFGQMLRWIWVK